jgi:hypothetical protein
MFILFFSKMLILLAFVRNLCLNVMIFRKINYMIYAYLYIVIWGYKCVYRPLAAIYFLMAYWSSLNIN